MRLCSEQLVSCLFHHLSSFGFLISSCESGYSTGAGHCDPASINSCICNTGYGGTNCACLKTNWFIVCRSSSLHLHSFVCPIAICVCSGLNGSCNPTATDGSCSCKIGYGGFYCGCQNSQWCVCVCVCVFNPSPPHPLYSHSILLTTA